MNKEEVSAGLLSRKDFFVQTKRLMESNTMISFEILRLDIEHFNFVNEFCGEAIGDRILGIIESKLYELIAPVGIVGYFRADDFFVVYPMHMKYREKIIQAMQEVVTECSVWYQLCFHYGVYPVRDAEVSVSCMCDRANWALQLARQNYLLTYGIYDDAMYGIMCREQKLLNRADKALQHGDFQVWFQPQYHISQCGTVHIIGAEALVRWFDPELGMISCAEFIPVFERTRLICRLDFYVWEQTCKLLANWKKQGIPLVPVSVNVSRVDINEADLVSSLDHLLERYNLQPELLRLEITESSCQTDSTGVIAVMKKLQNAGFTILMDDFGSGYSSFYML